MKKALVITVGTGVGKDREKVVDSLASGIAFSIKVHNPSKTVFIVTEESERDTVPKILEKTGLGKEDYEIKRISNMENIESIYNQSIALLSELAGEGFSPEEMVVDYTSGTKAMSAGAAIAAVAFEVETLSYVSGKREGSVVVYGTERPVLIRPYKVMVDSKLKTIANLFNINQFNACIEIIKQLKEKTEESQIQHRLSYYEDLCKGYSHWDKFAHSKGADILSKIKNIPSKNKKFLGRLANSDEKEPFYIADLLNNAERRFKEGKYDDAVARLYRTVELIGQYRLRVKFDINSSNVDVDKLDSTLKEKYGKIVGKNGKIKLGLAKDYELLADMGDDFGDKFAENNRLMDLLTNRNESILAHGLSVVSSEVFHELYGITMEFAKMVVPNIEELITNSEFPKFEELHEA